MAGRRRTFLTLDHLKRLKTAFFKPFCLTDLHLVLEDFYKKSQKCQKSFENIFN